MTVDDRAFDRLIEESQDLHSDGMRASDELLPDLADAYAEERADHVGASDVEQFDQQRQDHVERLGLTSGGVARTGILAGGFGALLATLLATPASAQNGGSKQLDVACLQTASGLEILAVNTYKAALGLPFISSGNPVIVKFAQTTMMQHDEHRKAFQAQTKTLGGKVQKDPNSKNKAVVDAVLPDLKEPLNVATLAMTLETVATNTYLYNMNVLSDTKTAALFGSIQGVECQHLATLRAVVALLDANAPQLVAVPVDASALPAAAGSVAFPDAFEPTTLASDPQEGAIS